MTLSSLLWERACSAGRTAGAEALGAYLLYSCELRKEAHFTSLETEAQRSAAGVQLVKPGAKRQSENKNTESLTFRASPQIFTELFKWMHSLIHFVISSF